LVHPNIAQPIDFGYDKRIRRYFFVAEFVRGQNLNHAIATATPKQALDLFAQGLQALDYMHRQGVFHCDLKPANILVTQDGVVKVIDFDVATRGTKAIGGTPPYFPPEILANPQLRPNARSDLYSMGITFFHCLTSQKPFASRNIRELKVAHQNFHIPLPSEVKPELGTLWDGILTGMMQKNPYHRFSTASAVLQQVHLLLGSAKVIFSAEDIEYRLNQHGVPIARAQTLEEAKNFLEEKKPGSDDEKKFLILEGARGLGSSYLLEEIKQAAQLQGANCITFNQFEQNLPANFPFLWIIDDLSSFKEGSNQDRLLELSAKLREIVHKGEGQEWKVILGGIPSFQEIPNELKAILSKNSVLTRLSPWRIEESRKWLEDIFQVEKVPDFLVEKIHEESKGSPKLLSELLQHYLEKHILFDHKGHWRKDLFHPSKMFVKEFNPEGLDKNLGRFIERFSKEEKRLLQLMAILYEAAPAEFLEAALGLSKGYAMLKRLGSQGIVANTEEDAFLITHEGIRQSLLTEMKSETSKKLHDLMAQVIQSPEWSGRFSQEALHFHWAHGEDRERAAEGWAYFGERAARKGLWESAFEYYCNAFERCDEKNIDKKFEFSIQRGKCLIQRNLLGETKQFFKSLLVEFSGQRLAKPEFFAKIYERLGVLETKKGTIAQAREYFQQGLACLDPTYEPLEQYLALRNFLAGLDLLEGKFADAIEAFQETHEIAHSKLSWEKRRILTNNDLGAALVKNGRISEAIQHWESQIEDLKNREDFNPLVRCYFQLGQTFFEQGMRDPALRYLELAREASQEIQNYEMELRIYNALANFHCQSSPELALENYERALDSAFQSPEPFSTAIILLNMGFLLEAEKQWARAKHCLSQGLLYLTQDKASERNNLRFIHAVYLGLARLALQLGQFTEALSHAEHASQLVSENASLREEEVETMSVLWGAQFLANSKEATSTASMIEKSVQQDKSASEQWAETQNKYRKLQQSISTSAKPKLQKSASHSGRPLSSQTFHSKKTSTFALRNDKTKAV